MLAERIKLCCVYEHKKIHNFTNSQFYFTTLDEGEICASISSQFQQTFIDEGYVISIGAAMVCEVLGESFMRGVIEQSIGLGV